MRACSAAAWTQSFNLDSISRSNSFTFEAAAHFRRLLAGSHQSGAAAGNAASNRMEAVAVTNNSRVSAPFNSQFATYSPASFLYSDSTYVIRAPSPPSQAMC